MKGHVIQNLPSGNPANQYGLYQGSMSNHDKVYQQIIHVLKHGRHAVDGDEGIKTIEIINRIYQAANTSQE